VNNPSIPNVTLPASDHRRLERLALMGADKTTWTHVFY
jgi:regulator of nucleoside diphosphate kinase